MDNGWEHAPWDPEFVADLAKPFPHTEAWNDRQGAPVYNEANLEEYDRKLVEFEKVYYHSDRINGAIPICHLGCAIRHWLVISGPERGNIWCDDRANEGGLYPLQSGNRGRVTFIEWYVDWLNAALAGCQKKSES